MKQVQQRKLQVLEKIQLHVEKLLNDQCPDIEIQLPKGIVRSRSSILFKPDSVELDKSKHLITQLSVALNTIEKAYNTYRDDVFEHHILFEVAGHTHAPPNVDPIGEESMSVSSRRAEKVREEIENRGTNPKILTSKGYGGSQPKDKLRPELNRRVELRLLDHDIAFPWRRRYSEMTPSRLTPLLMKQRSNHLHHHTNKPSISKHHHKLHKEKDLSVHINTASYSQYEMFSPIDPLEPIRGHAAASKLRVATKSLILPPEIGHFTPHILPDTYANISTPSERQDHLNTRIRSDSKSKGYLFVNNFETRLRDNLLPRSPHSPLTAALSEPHSIQVPELMSLVPDSSHITSRISLPTQEIAAPLLCEMYGERPCVSCIPSSLCSTTKRRRRVRKVIATRGSQRCQYPLPHTTHLQKTSNLNIWAARQSELWAGLARLQRQMAERDKSRVNRIEDRMNVISIKLKALTHRIGRVEKCQW